MTACGVEMATKGKFSRFEGWTVKQIETLLVARRVDRVFRQAEERAAAMRRDRVIRDAVDSIAPKPRLICK